MKVITNKNVHSVIELPAFLYKDAANAIYEILRFFGLNYFAFFLTKKDIKDNLGIGVYIFIDNYQVPAYVGSSGDMKKRIKDKHEKYQGEEIITINTHDIEKARRLERIIYELLLPRKNRTVPGTMPGKLRR